MITTQNLINIRTLTFAIGGLMCGGYALAALLGTDRGDLPHWLPPMAGIMVAVVYFIAAYVAGPDRTNAATDESYQHDGRLAAAVGFWVALAMGTGLWITGLGGAMQLAITLTTAAAAFMLAHVVLDLRGR